MDLKVLASRDDYVAVVERAARAAYDANVAYCKENEIDAPLPFSVVRDSLVSGVLLLIDHPGMTLEQQHEAWVAYKVKEGWKYGKVKDAKKKTHPQLVPFSDLPEVLRLKDEIFQKTVLASLMESMPKNEPIDASPLPHATPEQGVSPHLDAPGALAHPATAEVGEEAPEAAASDDEIADACEAGKPRIALVGKYGDRVPVQLKSTSHLEELHRTHGEGNVEVQP